VRQVVNSTVRIVHPVVNMRRIFSHRMSVTPKSYIMQLISICQDPQIISFASGLPDTGLLPTESVSRAAMDLLASEDGRSALQYSITEGYLPLRETIADRYRRRLGVDVDPQDMIMVNGSQQCFDLMGKVMLDPGSPMAIERPGYLGAVQAFSMYEPRFLSVDLQEDGPDMGQMEKVMRKEPKMFYSVPNSQNPMGVTYSHEIREAIASLLKGGETLVLEDDAYGELHFEPTTNPLLYSMMPENVVLMGSFSKILAPGMRCGWMVGPKDVMEKVTIAKEAADLHSNYLSQRIIHCWLEGNDLDAHVETINRQYKAKRDLMMRLMDELMPEGVWHTRPSGGLFIWMALPKGDTMDLFEKALEAKVAIMPGAPFYTDGRPKRGARLNFSNSSLEAIEEGMTRLAEVTRDYLNSL
jgi:2-aminoadipate transaminase